MIFLTTLCLSLGLLRLVFEDSQNISNTTSDSWNISVTWILRILEYLSLKRSKEWIKNSLKLDNQEGKIPTHYPSRSFSPRKSSKCDIDKKETGRNHKGLQNHPWKDLISGNILRSTGGHLSCKKRSGWWHWDTWYSHSHIKWYGLNWILDRYKFMYFGNNA